MLNGEPENLGFKIRCFHNSFHHPNWSTVCIPSPDTFKEHATLSMQLEGVSDSSLWKWQESFRCDELDKNQQAGIVLLWKDAPISLHALPFDKHLLLLSSIGLFAWPSGFTLKSSDLLHLFFYNFPPFCVTEMWFLLRNQTVVKNTDSYSAIRTPSRYSNSSSSWSSSSASSRALQ